MEVYWADVGGNDEVKQSMKEAVEWPLKHPGVSPLISSVMCSYTTSANYLQSSMVVQSCFPPNNG